MAGLVHTTPLNQIPSNPEELERCLADPEWRIFSGCLYKIMIKGDGDDDAYSVPFKPNRAQKRFLKRLWHRNIILKARQLGFTTLIAILWLDHALFNADQRCGIIAQDREAAEVIFRDKVRYAYNNLPDEIRERFPLKRDSATELLFAHNNSSVRVATSMRSGTIHRLHISEFGKICAKYPEKAKEVMTGSIPAVPTNGILVIESTAEGANGEFYELSSRAETLHYTHVKLTVRDYPSTPAEAFQQSTEGHYLTKVLQVVTKRGGICKVPVLDLPVYTFWDIGASDGCAIWFAQSLRGEDRFIDYYEEHDEDLRHYVRHLQGLGYVFGKHYLPHDAAHKRLGDYNKSTQEQLQALMPGQSFVIVPRITELQTGINTLRKHMKGAWYDKERCAFGVERLRGYKKKYSTALAKFINEPDKANGCTEGADAHRQWAQAKETGLYIPSDDSYGSSHSSYEEPEAPDWRA